MGKAGEISSEQLEHLLTNCADGDHISDADTLAKLGILPRLRKLVENIIGLDAVKYLQWKHTPSHRYLPELLFSQLHLSHQVIKSLGR